MKVQQLIEKYKKLEGVWDAPGAETARQIFLQDLEQLDEPKKVVVPQFVADWIDYFKKYSGSLYGSTAPYSYYGHAITDDFVGDVKKTLGWIRNNSEAYARAWLDGYEVEEEEKRYYIRLKIDDENYNYLNYIKHLSAWCLAGIKKDKKFRTEHTRKQLEDAGFGEVFNSPLFEVEEVEE